MYTPVEDVVGVDWAEMEIDSELACNCEETCRGDCQCVVRSHGLAYDSGGKIRESRLKTHAKPIFECWKDCLCVKSCGNRGVQQAAWADLRVVPCGDKGLGVITQSKIAARTYVCQYHGEDVDWDSDGAYVFEVKERTESGEWAWRVDAVRFGNVARFFNHSCDPNLRPVPVRTGHVRPRIAFFTMREISAGEELTFQYRAQSSGRTCLCGAATCEGFF